MKEYLPPIEEDDDVLELPPKWHNYLIAVPSAFTLAGIFCGFYAIAHIVGTSSLQALHQASIAIFFAGFFDMLDGRVARLTKTQSEFGLELDSLADVISFGVAPAILAYRWSLFQFGNWGVVIAFCFTACGVIRLARFNVLSKKEGGGGGEFFVGLPIPLAAISLVALILTHYWFSQIIPSNRYWLTSFLLFLSFLMVSKIPYWSFKKSRIKTPAAVFLFSLIIGLIVSSFFFPSSIIILAILSAYIFSGLFRYIFLLFKS